MGVQQTWLHMCEPNETWDEDQKMLCYHEGCFSFKPYPLDEFSLAATTYLINPPHSLEVQRVERTQKILAKKLKADLLSRFPAEICSQVAKYLVREAAVFSRQEISQDAVPRHVEVDLSKDIYVSYIVVEGVRYIKFVYNAADDNEKNEGIRVWKGREKSEVVLDIAYDHFGVRDLDFRLPGDESTHPLRDTLETHGTWWTSLVLPSAESSRALLVKTDVSPSSDYSILALTNTACLGLES